MISHDICSKHHHINEEISTHDATTSNPREMKIILKGREKEFQREKESQREKEFQRERESSNE